MEFIVVGGILGMAYMFGTRDDADGSSDTGATTSTPMTTSTSTPTPTTHQNHRPPTRVRPSRSQSRSVANNNKYGRPAPARAHGAGALAVAPPGGEREEFTAYLRRGSRTTMGGGGGGGGAGARQPLLRRQATLGRRRRAAGSRQWGDGTPQVMGSDVSPYYSGTQAPGDRATNPSTRRLADLTGGVRSTGARWSRRTAPVSESLFAPTRDIGTVYGTRATAGRAARVGQIRGAFDRSRRTGDHAPLPARVAPGIGAAAGDRTLVIGHGGFHQQTERERYMPRGIDELRPGNDPRVSYGGHVAAPAAAGVGRATLRPGPVRGKTQPLGGPRFATGGGAGVLAPAMGGGDGGAASLRDTRRAIETDRPGASAPVGPPQASLAHEATPAPARHIHLDASGLESHPTAYTRGTQDMAALPSAVRKTILDTTGYEAPAVAGIGVRDTRASGAPVRRQGLDLSGLPAAPAAPGLGATDRATRKGVGVLSSREKASRSAGPANPSGGVRSYEDVLAATFSATRGKTASDFVSGAMASVVAAGSRGSVSGVPIADRAEVLGSRPGPGLSAHGHADGYTGGDDTRARRGVAGIDGDPRLLSAATSYVPATTADAPPAVSGNEVAGVERQQRFVEMDGELLDIGADQLRDNPFNVPVVG